MKNYKGYNIELYWLPQYATFCFYKIDRSDERLYTVESIKDCKNQIDDMLCTEE